jgi:hypothetical protein
MVLRFVPRSRDGMVAIMSEESATAEFYRTNGYVIFRKIIPPALITQLRSLAEEGRAIARRLEGPQAQRLQPLGEHLDVTAVRAFTALPELTAAIARVLTPRHQLTDPAKMALLFEPAEHCWSTEWHRDQRDHMNAAQFEQVYPGDRWERVMLDPNFFNQINAPLYEDNATWYVPGSHFRAQDTLGELSAARSADRAEVENWRKQRTEAEQERFLEEYSSSMPGAVRITLQAGDLVLYRNLGWHLGSYLPYRKRATLHCGANAPEFLAFQQENAEVIAQMRTTLAAAKKAGDHA